MDEFDVNARTALAAHLGTALGSLVESAYDRGTSTVGFPQFARIACSVLNQDEIWSAVLGPLVDTVETTIKSHLLAGDRS